MDDEEDSPLPPVQRRAHGTPHTHPVASDAETAQHLAAGLHHVRTAPSGSLPHGDASQPTAVQTAPLHHRSRSSIVAHGHVAATPDRATARPDHAGHRGMPNAALLRQSSVPTDSSVTPTVRTHRSGTIQHRVASLSAQSDRARRPAATLSLSDLTKNLPQNKSVRTVLRRNFMEVNEEYLAVLSALNGHFSEQYVAMIAVCGCVCSSGGVANGDGVVTLAPWCRYEAHLIFPRAMSYLREALSEAEDVLLFHCNPTLVDATTIVTEKPFEAFWNVISAHVNVSAMLDLQNWRKSSHCGRCVRSMSVLSAAYVRTRCVCSTFSVVPTSRYTGLQVSGDMGTPQPPARCPVCLRRAPQ